MVGKGDDLASFKAGKVGSKTKLGSGINAEIVGVDDFGDFNIKLSGKYEGEVVDEVIRKNKMIYLVG